MSRMTIQDQDILCFRILKALDAEMLDGHELARIFNTDYQIIGRMIKMLRRRFGITIKASATYGYQLVDWGVFDRDRYIAHFSRLVDEKSAGKRA